MERYYLFLSVPARIDRDKLGLELCILHNAFDFLSKDKGITPYSGMNTREKRLFRCTWT